jgi:putative addiction module component (TIGR02574 family)
MGTEARALLAQVLRLPVAERAELAAELIASVDGEPDPDAEAAWAAEIEHRARRALQGESQGKAWEAVRAGIMEKIH